ncbi:MAG TPA: hypothetical protein VFB62_17760 [Polyangiaceae bacterium]|nr:hypothetical protein [Polyangiaceae bacterium]
MLNYSERVQRVFLLSPASCSGKRAQILLRQEASFPLACAVRSPAGAPLGEVFSFLSGLYFRGKLTYARVFAPGRAAVITTNRGLVSPDEHVDAAALRSFSEVDIQGGDPRFTKPLLRDAKKIAKSFPTTEIVLLGSIASDKYVDILVNVFGVRLLFPSDFVGRGDMSRGGLMLRAARDECELVYEPVLGAVRNGARPPRLTPRPGILREAIDRARHR